MKHLLLFVLSIFITSQAIGQKKITNNFFKYEILNNENLTEDQVRIKEKHNLASSGQFFGIASAVAGAAFIGKGFHDKLSSISILSSKSPTQKKQSHAGDVKIVSGLAILSGSIAILTASTISKKRTISDYNKRRLQQEKEPHRIKYEVSIDTKKLGFTYQF